MSQKVPRVRFEVSAESVSVIAAVLTSHVTKRVVRLLYEKALEGKDEEGKLKGLTFNGLCRGISASRTTVHRVLAELAVRDEIIWNEEGYVETSAGKRLATIYRLKEDFLPIVEFLYPSLPSE